MLVSRRPIFRPERDPARMREQIEERQKGLRSVLLNGNLWSTANSLFYGQPEQILEEFSRIWEQRAATLSGPQDETAQIELD